MMGGKTAADHIAEWLLNDESVHLQACRAARISHRCHRCLRDMVLWMMWDATPDSHGGRIAGRYSHDDLCGGDWQQVREWLLAE